MQCQRQVQLLHPRFQTLIKHPCHLPYHLYTVSHKSSSTQSVSQSSPLQTPMSSNGVSSTPTVAGASSSHQDQSAPGSTPLTTAAKRRSPLSDLLNLHKAGSKTPSTGRTRVLTSAECLHLLKEKRNNSKRKRREEKWRGN